MPESRRGRLTIYPSIDMRGGEVVRLAQGDFERQTTYDRDPALLVQQWANLGAERLHVVDLDGAKAGAVQQAEAIEAIVRAEPRLKVQAGGGVREIDDVRRLLNAGCDRVVVGTRGVRDRAWLESILSGDDIAGRVVLAVDAKGGRVAVGGWQETTDVAVLDLAADVSTLPLAALLYTDVARDGMMTGTDADGTQQLARATELPVLASGGVGSIDDLQPLISSDVEGVIVGRALHEGTLDLEAALRLGRGVD